MQIYTTNKMQQHTDVHLAKMLASVAMVVLLAVFMLLQTSAAYAQRIVVLSSDVADIVVALGGAKQVVGKDAVNKNPALKHAKTVGLHRSVTAEAVMSVKPDLVLGSWMVQPPSIFAQLQRLGVKAVNVAEKDDFQSYAQSIIRIGKLINQEAKAKAYAQKWLAQINNIKKAQQQKAQQQNAKQSSALPRYLLSYDGRIVAGKNTVPDKLISLAGGVNAATFSGLKPMSREGWLKAKPDVIIIAEHHQKIIGGKAKLSKRPEVVSSPAAKKGAIFFWPAHSYFRYSLNTPDVVKKLHDLAK